MRKATDDHAWIIGASSGIGEALALHMAAKGHKVAVSARNEKELRRVHETLEGKGHLQVSLDVTDSTETAKAAAQILDQWGQIDRMVFMAGIYTPMLLGELDLDETKKTIETNLLGAFNAVEAVLPAMTKRGTGQIALCASVAGYRGLPRGQPYGATKAGMINLAESLRAEQGDKLDVKVINPGFVKSRLTDKNDFRMPGIISAQKAAEQITKGLYSSGFEIHFPKGFTRMVELLGMLPDWAYFKIMNNAKKRKTG